MIFVNSYNITLITHSIKMNSNPLAGTNRQAIDETNIPIRSKNKFVNYLFYNTDLEQASFCKTTICFFSLFIIFFALSIFLYAEVSTVHVETVQYYSQNDHLCTTTTTSTGSNATICSVTIEIDQHMQQPVYVMYQVDNFYQNIRNYIQSKNSNQLAGNHIGSGEALSCYPFINNQQMNKTSSWKGIPLDMKAVANPCGAIAISFFNDTYSLTNSAGQSIYINQTGISWQGDKGQAYKAHPQSSKVQWINPQNEHFIVWMRTSGLPNFKKPWGRIDQDLPIGNYTVTAQIQTNMENIMMTRHFVLTTNSKVGGRNFLLPTSFLLISLMSCLAGLFFCIRFRALKEVKLSS